MVVKGDHVRNYLQLLHELERLKRNAPDGLDSSESTHDNFYGTMTKWQLQRLIPGLIRVEVLLNESKYGTQEVLDPVPITDRPLIDPQPCCQMSHQTSGKERPEFPHSDQLFLWEANIVSLGVRQLPNGLWVLTQRGPRYNLPNETIGDYWSGRDGYFPKRVMRPRPAEPSQVNNQGGWMATRHQIWDWHTSMCPGSFLPPYDLPHFTSDGLDLRNVEYWSGGLHLFTNQAACNLQRIIPLDPELFSRHLVYHASNNKQRQLQWAKHRFVKANDLFGQLTTVRRNAARHLEMQTN